MDNGFLSYLLPLIEFTAAFFATIHFNKYKNSSERYFMYFLWYTFIVDFTGVILKSFSIDNSWLYNIFTITSFLFYFYWFYTVLKRKAFKNMAILAAVLFLGVTLLTYFVPELSGRGYAFVTAAIGLLILTVFNHYQLLKGDEVLVLKYKLSFWISTALLLFYMGIIPLMLLSGYLGVEGSNFYIILVSLNVILYGCYVIGFIWTKEKYNRF